MKNKNINDLYKCKSNKIAKPRTISLNVMLWRVLKTYIKIGKNGTIESRMETHMPVRAERLNVCNRRDFPAYSVQATKHRQLCLVLTGFLTRHTPFPLLSTF